MQYDPNHKFSHFRKRDAEGNVNPRAGASVAYAVKDGELFCAAAYCGPRDNFSYQLGRIKASARLANFLNHPEKNDANIYFTIAIKDDNVSAAVRGIRTFMVDGLGYSTRYEQTAAEEAA